MYAVVINGNGDSTVVVARPPDIIGQEVIAINCVKWIIYFEHAYSPVPVQDPKNDRTRTGRARYHKWDQTLGVQFQYGTLNTTIPELAEPGTGNWTTRIESSSSTEP